MHLDENKKVDTNPQNNRPFALANYLNREYMNKKITCIPLEFQYIPVEIMSKQFTKLNNTHPYRIHYLGPRFKNTLQLHKKNSFSDKRQFVYNTHLFGNQRATQAGKPQKSHIFNSMNNYQSESEINQPNNNDNQPLDESVSQILQPSLSQAERYKVDMRKIYHSFQLEEKLKNSQYFKSSVYYRAFEGMNPSLDKTQQFVFNSCFQNGNLDCVIKLEERQFDLFLRIDSNTRGHLLWFYFSVKNYTKLGKIKMNICNFSKSKTLYKQGLRPYIFSSIKFKKQDKGWQQNGANLGLEKTQLRYDVLQNKVTNSNINCLTLQYDFQHQNDEVFFSYCIPYTYSQLLRDIDRLPEKYVQKQILGKSLLGTNIPILHITDGLRQKIQTREKLKSQYESTTSNINSNSQINGQRQTQRQAQKQTDKKVILITGRIHPSQSNSSYVMMGFIRWLCSEEKQAVQVRKIARFIIIPMVNPDGVIIGNSRTSASGKDLNRQYINPDPSMHPEAFMIKEIAKKMHQEHQICLFLDFHGHSRKKNTFFYGPVYNISEPNYYKCRILPKMIQKISNPFRYHSCSFSIIQDKKKTARASMFQNLGIQYTYTVQSSIGYFYDCQKLKVFQFSQEEWKKMGSSIAEGTSVFIIGIDSYEQIISEKRKLRLRKKKFYRYPNKKVDYLQDQMYLELQNQEEPLKIVYQDKDNNISPKHSFQKSKSNFFMDMLQELRTTTAKTQKPSQKNDVPKQIDVKDIDIDQDSDSHDQKQDMEANKLNEFKSLVKHEAKQRDLTSKQKHNLNLNLKFQYEKKSQNKIKIAKKINQFQLLSEMQKEKTAPSRNIKTGEARRNYSPQKMQIHLISRNQRENTLPEELPQTKDASFLNFVKNNFQTPFLNNQIQKRPIYSSTRRAKKQPIQNNNLEKRQKTIGNYFGEYRLVINQGNSQNEIKKEKLDFMRKLQSRRQNSRKNRAESSSQIKSNVSLRNSTQSNCFNAPNKIQKIQPELVHGPTQFTFSLPISETPQAPKSFILKPKLKVHLRQKPRSVQSIQNSLSLIQKQSSLYLKQKSQKIIQSYCQTLQKQSSRDKNIPKSSLIQQGGRFSNKRKYFSQTNTGRQSNRCTKIDLNDVNSASIFNNFKIHQR